MIPRFFLVLVSVVLLAFARQLYSFKLSWKDDCIMVSFVMPTR